MNNNIEIFQEVNHWWRTGRVRDELIEKVERWILPEINAALYEKQIILIEGPRRTGKTSLLYMLIDHLIKSGEDPRYIFYLSLDDPLIHQETVIQDIVSFIENFCINMPLLEFKKQIFIFLDEVTTLKNWELILKRYYDLRYPFKFIISSSSSAFMKKHTKESLVGRVIDFQLSPFSFQEFLALKNRQDLRRLIIELNLFWQQHLSYEGITYDIFPKLLSFEKELSFYQRELEIELGQYLFNGGFPEYIQIKDEGLRQRYFWENIVQRVVYYDIPEIFHITDTTLLRNILMYCILYSGDVLNITNLSNSLDASRLTVSNYLTYLESGLLIKVLEKYAKSKESRMRAYNKVYTVDPGLFTSLHRISMEKAKEKGLFGKMAEIAVFSSLLRYHKYVDIFYYREREKEVDFVLGFPDGLVPIEVKYRKDASKPQGIYAFMQKFNLKKGMIITKDTLSLKDNILYVPLYCFL